MKFSTIVSSHWCSLQPKLWPHFFFHKRLSSLLSDRWKESYASVFGWVRCLFFLSTLKGNIMYQRNLVFSNLLHQVCSHRYAHFFVLVL